ncbi:GGDEF domain-containing protein [Pseudomonas sp. ABC1]|uniref:sensor domain-containing diguanylate cyclase n=1 Tax=Pseudomonas sp. ABC1 TaxID=2748080 RepID=UPI0015C2EA90|nr:sensor domain-containing diguanylate cyclase [Pseudomonas sp. ABC1]QLF92464.1 GGDEF domain-containing protein [Pseudomonas sp. ABC1]
MPIQHLFRSDLRRLILLLTIISSLATLANALHASYRVQRQLLIDNTLEANHAYAAKLANSTEDFLKATQQVLAYSTRILRKNMDDTEQLLAQASRLRLQFNSFNSVVITDAQGWVLATSPETLEIKGRRLTTPGPIQALQERRPLISDPYIAITGRLVIFISSPIFDDAGEYLGLVGGTLYLNEGNILHNLLGSHYHRDGSYLYAVDRNRTLLYHPQPERVGKRVGANQAISDVINGKDSASIIINSEGTEMLAGYTPIGLSGWGIVAQRPMEATLAPLHDLMLKVLKNSAPLAVLTLLLAGILARKISKPLWQLAKHAEEMDHPRSSDSIQRIRSWYFEAAELKKAMLVGISLLQQKIGKLNLDIQTDPLTGLQNRRGLESALESWEASGQSFAAIALDIDHFKQVNDTHGHDIGDNVITHMAELMRSCSRGDDILCRSGGEEFLMLLPGASPEIAAMVAERLRSKVESNLIPEVGKITVSAGIALWPNGEATPKRTLKLADEALYQAKQSGRNRVVIANGRDDVDQASARP